MKTAKHKRAEPAQLQEAVNRFMAVLFEDVPENKGGSQPNRMHVEMLVHRAFAAYQQDWDCHDHDIRDWKWPAEELKQDEPFSRSGGSWMGDLREAFIQARRCLPRTHRKLR